MSESDSFIDEVSEEVRRDRLFKLFKKYAWILGLVVVAIVGGTAYNEWDKSASQKEARLTGDVLRAAAASGEASALNAVIEQGAPSAVIAELQLANVLEADGDTEGALTALRSVATNLDVALVYSDLAWLKILMLDGANMAASERSGAYERLMAPGAPYRLLAQEQLAMQYVRDGDNEAAIGELTAILNDPSVTASLRSRAQQLIVALGGELEPESANG